MGQNQDYSLSLCGSFAWLDTQNGFVWKTYQRSLLEGWEPYSESWPRAGTMRNGVCSERTTWEPPTVENGSGSSHGGEMWPTPMAHNAKETNAPSESRRNTPTLAAQVGGPINPQWVEWLMGFPVGWTDCEHSETP